jgi:hypothetical protein
LNQTMKSVDMIARNPWLTVIAALASIIPFSLALVGYFSDTTKNNFLFVSTLATLFYLVSLVYSLRIRAENEALKELAEYFHDINLIYRTQVRELFFANVPSKEKRLQIERDTLESVVQRIENIFMRATGKKCLSTIKLLSTDSSNRLYAQTYVRSQTGHKRDHSGNRMYKVGDGSNTSFDTALIYRNDGSLPHFFSPDLGLEKSYNNERQHYERFYRSTLVVPIYGKNPTNPGAETDEVQSTETLGFLCVDTLTLNRLNNDHHLYMLSSLATQMYNFMKAIRGSHIRNQ